MTSNTSVNRKLTEKLYLKYAEWLNERANSVLHDEDLSEDIVQDCMLIVLTHIDSLKELEESEQRKYLASAVDKLSKKCLLNQTDKTTPMQYEDDSFDKNLIREESPESAVEDKIFFEILIDELGKMNEHDRKIIELKYIYLRSDHDIAPILGIKENSVRMTVRRSILRLKKQLGIIHNYESIQ